MDSDSMRSTSAPGQPRSIAREGENESFDTVVPKTLHRLGLYSRALGQYDTRIDRFRSGATKSQESGEQYE